MFEKARDLHAAALGQPWHDRGRGRAESGPAKAGHYVVGRLFGLEQERERQRHCPRAVKGHNSRCQRPESNSSSVVSASARSNASIWMSAEALPDDRISPEVGRNRIRERSCNRKSVILPEISVGEGQFV